MAVVLLVRHGQSTLHGGYGGLTELGHAQAVATAEVVRRSVPVGDLTSGTLERQVQTAQVCRAALPDGQACRPDARWDEYDWQELLAAFPGAVSMPADPGEDPRAFQAALDASMLRWIDSGSGGESLPPWCDFRESTAQALDDVFAILGAGETGVVVSSAGRIVAACAALLYLPPPATIALHRVMLNGGVTKVIRGRTGTSVVSINEHGHLDALGRTYLTYR